MGNLGKKLLGIGLLSATAGAAVYYFTKKKEENPDLQEEFADFQDNLKETAASAVNVASKFKEVVEKSMDQAVNKADENTSPQGVSILTSIPDIRQKKKKKIKENTNTRPK